MKPVIKYAARYNLGGDWGARKFMAYVQRALKQLGRREVIDAIEGSISSAGAWLGLKRQVCLEFYNIGDILSFAVPRTYIEFADLVSPLTEDENAALHERVLAFCALLSDDEDPVYHIAWNDGDPRLRVTFELPGIG